MKSPEEILTKVFSDYLKEHKDSFVTEDLIKEILLISEKFSLDDADTFSLRIKNISSKIKDLSQTHAKD